MKEVTFKLILECEDKAGVEDTLKRYLEKYLINAHSLEAIKLRIVAGDQLPPMGFDLFSMKLEKETKNRPWNSRKGCGLSEFKKTNSSGKSKCSTSCNDWSAKTNRGN